MKEVATTFYTWTHEAWESMLKDVQAATKTIDFEQYIFAVDSIGKKFIEVFVAKAKAGVKVRLICDAVGSYSLYNSNIPDYLRSVGIEVKFFNPISPWRITNFTSNFFRDHRKILIIDGEIGHIGGVGIQEHMRDWRDTHMRVTGAIVHDLLASFVIVWENISRGPAIRMRQIRHYIRKYNLITNSPGLRYNYIYQTLVANIRNAKKYIYLTTPYFIPDVRLFRVLRLAARRGIDVRIVVPNIADHYFVDHARESYFTLALKAGIKIYLYQPVMMHAKAAIIDDEWATAGSYNLDTLSAVFNHEANISSNEHFFIQDLKRHFLDDLRDSHHILYEKWIKRPLHKKFRELLTWPFHSLM